MFKEIDQVSHDPPILVLIHTSILCRSDNKRTSCVPVFQHVSVKALTERQLILQNRLESSVEYRPISLYTRIVRIDVDVNNVQLWRCLSNWGLLRSSTASSHTRLASRSPPENPLPPRQYALTTSHASKSRPDLPSHPSPNLPIDQLPSYSIYHLPVAQSTNYPPPSPRIICGPARH